MSENKKYATIQFQVNPDLSSAEQLKLMHNISKDMKAIDGVKIKPAGAQVMMLYGIDNIGANKELMIGAGLSIIFSIFINCVSSRKACVISVDTNYFSIRFLTWRFKITRYFI
ncbi:hypothetical protein ACT7DH_22830 [Bacillus pacificus]